MADKIPVREGVTPSARPTEWTTAVVGLVSAMLLFYADRDVAALAAAVGGALPTIVTAGVSYWEKRHATTTTTVEATTE